MELETPFLDPSFSSRGFPNISAIIEILRVDVSNVCLISAFDIAQGDTSIAFEEIADVITIDSGVYEMAPTAVAIDSFLPACTSAYWSREKYRAFLVESEHRMASTRVLVVSFDTYSHKTPKDMLRHFVEYSSRRVNSPIADTTGQSLHVNDYLGGANSQERQRVSGALSRLSKRLEASEKRGSVDDLKAIFGESE